jgi:hypothetical protein
MGYEDDVQQFVADTEAYQERFDVSPVYFKDVSTASLNAYVLGEFQYYMCWFVKTASVDEEYLVFPFDSEARLHTRNYIINELRDMQRTPKGSIRRRFVSEYMKHISLRDPSLKGEQLRFQEDIKPYLVESKQSFGDVPQDAFQKSIASLVKYLIRVWESHVTTITSEAPRHPSVRRIYDKRKELQLDFIDRAKTHSARKRYGEFPRSTVHRF